MALKALLIANREVLAMDEGKEYIDRTDRVRSLLSARLGCDPDNSERFGNGLFVFGGAEYSEQGRRGDVVWYVSRVDDPLRRSKRITFEWRDYTPEKIAESLLAEYDRLAGIT